MAKQEANPRLLVHTPAELATSYVQWAEQIQSDAGIPLGVPCVDKVMIPLRAGDLVPIIARPGHGKTSLMAFWAKQESDRILERGMEKEEAVVYCTWEQAAEELQGFFVSGDKYSISDLAWGRVDLDTVRRQMVKRARVPIWVVGHGIGRAGQNVPRMTPDVVLAAIESMQEDFGVRPTLLLFDYIQIIPIAHASERTQQATEAPVRIKELALRIGAPAVVGAQARQEVDDRQIKIPELRDAQWASAIGQTADKVFSLWRPSMTEEEGVQIRLASGKQYEVTQELLIMQMLKQRGEQGRHTLAMYFDPAYLKLAELETRKLDYAF